MLDDLATGESVIVAVTHDAFPKNACEYHAIVMTQDAAQNGTSDKCDNHTYHELDEPQSIRRSRFTSTGEWPYRIINTQRHDDRGY